MTPSPSLHRKRKLTPTEGTQTTLASFFGGPKDPSKKKTKEEETQLAGDGESPENDGQVLKPILAPPVLPSDLATPKSSPDNQGEEEGKLNQITRESASTCNSTDAALKQEENLQKEELCLPSPPQDKKETAAKDLVKLESPPSLEPIIPHPIPPPSSAWTSTNTNTPRRQTTSFSWRSVERDMLLVRTAVQAPRHKIAALDLDGTLVQWRVPSVGGGGGRFRTFFPRQFSDYELWSPQVITQLRQWHDQEQYKLVVISNQGGIQKAGQGKIATLVKSVIDWIEHLVDRPIFAVVSTHSPNNKRAPGPSLHKPNAALWDRMIHYCNRDIWDATNLSTSFFVGDADNPLHPAGDVDRAFAQAVSVKYATTTTSADSKGLRFCTPEQVFGPSSMEQRQRQQQQSLAASTALTGPALAPARACTARAALTGGYLTGPLLLLLCGVQGSGKSTFCARLLQYSRQGHHHGSQPHSSTGAYDPGEERPVLQDQDHWVHICQDIFRQGKPGTRAQVEQAAWAALQQGHSVVLDRMHLQVDQRQHFYHVAQTAQVPVHVVVLHPPENTVLQRVLHRSTSHPVHGSEGVQLTRQSLGQLVIPTYHQEPSGTLISCTSTEAGAKRLAVWYGQVMASDRADHHHIRPPRPQSNAWALGNGAVTLPMITLGTMGLGKREAEKVATMALEAGFSSVDTAPTYNNEEQIGRALASAKKQNDDGRTTFSIVKVPKRAVRREQVRDEVESSFQKLQLEQADLLLLHWPCEPADLAEIWKEMEQLHQQGKCRALGVCNFNVAALSYLLAHCRVRPLVNQVERHPLLPQWELIDYCSQQDITIQAHTPLGQGKDILLKHVVVVDIAEKMCMKPAQVVLQWNLQHGTPVVPKASTRDHLLQLQSCKPLSSDQMKSLDGIADRHRFVAPPFMFGSSPFSWS